MNVWSIPSAGVLERKECPVPEPEAGKIKVHVTKVMIGGTDVYLYKGSLKTKYPIIPGRFAVGLVADENGGALFPKGSRVLLHTFRPAKDTGTAKKDFSREEKTVCGLTQDGFLRDFVFVSEDEMTPLPDSVNDNDALLVHFVAHAKAVVDKLGAQKGSHVAVIGADKLGILISLLLIYQQVSPILIDSRRDRLDYARKCGVYYTVCQSDDVFENVANITGGRLADGAIYVISADGNDSSLAFRVCKREGSAVLCGFNCYSASLNFETALKRQITVFGVSDAYDSLEPAINLIANKAIVLNSIRANQTDVSRANEILKQYAESSDLDQCEMNILSLI